jgi:outer membrane autotransporter protein
VSPVGLLTADLAYHANDVTLTYAQGSFVPFAQTRNQQAVARNLDVIASQTSSSAVALIQYLDSIADPSNKLPVAYNQISPEELTALRTISLAGMDAQGNQFLKRASELRAGYRGLYIDLYNANASVGNEAQTTNRPWGVYLETIGEFGNVDGDSNASGYHWSGGGATLGVDRRLNDQFVVGAAASYISGDAGLSQSGSISFDSGLAEVYAVWFQQGLHLEGMFGGGINSCDTMRQGLNGVAKGSTGSTMWTWLLSGGYDWQVESWSFGPQMAVQYESARIDSFTEKGSLAPLKIGSQSVDALSTQMGAAVRFRGHVKGTWTFITPELNLAWRHNYSDTTFSLKSRLASGDGNTFTVNGPDLGSDSLVGNLGVTVQWTAAVSSYLNFAMQYAQSGQQAQYLTGGVRLGF